MGFEVILFYHLLAVRICINESPSGRDDKRSDCRFIVEFLSKEGVTIRLFVVYIYLNDFGFLK